MRQREHEACLVARNLFFAVLFGVPPVGDYKEAGGVVFVGLDALLQYFHAVHGGDVFSADSGVSAQVLVEDVFRALGGIFGLHHFHARVCVEKFAALHQGNRVGVYFGDVVPVVVGQAHNRVRDVQAGFADDLKSAFPQQFMILQQAPRNGVFYGYQSDDAVVVFDAFENIFERGAVEHIYLLAAEIAVGGDVVERAFASLYGDAFHLFLVYIKKNPVL